MWFYGKLSRSFVKGSYIAKHMLLSFLGVHVPLICLCLYLLVSSPLMWQDAWPIVLVLLIATIAGTVATLAGQYLLLQPIIKASEAIRGYLAFKAVPLLPTSYPDEAGRLMHDVQEGITRLDCALDAARSAHRLAESRERETVDILKNLSHELRTPLNAIVGFAEVLQHDLRRSASDGDGEEDDGSDARTHDYVQTIKDSGGDMLKLVQTLTDLGRIRAGQQEGTVEPVDVSDVARRAVSLTTVAAHEQGVPVLVTGAEIPRVGLADERALKQLILHLINDGLDRTDRSRAIAIDIAERDARVVLSMRFDGCPLVQDDLPAGLRDVFSGGALPEKAFGGIDSVSARGLTLTLVHALTQVIGATLSIGNNGDHGRTVTVTLPRVPAAAQAA